MEYWGLEVEADAETPSPAAAAIEFGSSFLKNHWGVLVIGGAMVLYFLVIQAWDYGKRVKARQKEERERAELQILDDRASAGDVVAIERIQQLNENAAAACQEAQNVIENQNDSCPCM